MLIKRPQLCRLVLIRTSGESRLSRSSIVEPQGCCVEYTYNNTFLSLVDMFVYLNIMITS